MDGGLGQEIAFFVHPRELWEVVEQLADAANQNNHEGLASGEKCQQNSQGGANKANEKVIHAKGVHQQSGICFLLGSAGPAKSHSTVNRRWSADDHNLLEKMSVIPLRIQTKMPDRCMEGRLQKALKPPPLETKIPGAQAAPMAQQIRLHLAPLGSRLAAKIQMAHLVAKTES